jgi:hypothetical protein
MLTRACDHNNRLGAVSEDGSVCANMQDLVHDWNACAVLTVRCLLMATPARSSSTQGSARNAKGVDGMSADDFEILVWEEGHSEPRMCTLKEREHFLQLAQAEQARET